MAWPLLLERARTSITTSHLNQPLPPEILHHSLNVLILNHRFLFPIRYRFRTNSVRCFQRTISNVLLNMSRTLTSPPIDFAIYIIIKSETES